MLSTLISPAAVIRALAATVVLLVVAIVLSGILGGSGFLGLVTWALLVGGIAVGTFLIARAGRPIAGAGAILAAVGTWMAFFIMPPAFVWTGLFFFGILLIWKGTSEDTPNRISWPIFMLRAVVGWAWIDNAQDHFLNNWLPGGGQGPGSFLQTATGAATRPARDFSDAAYQGFLKGVVVPGADQWAALTICGELAFGLLLAMGFLTPIATIGLLWHSLNYMFMKGFTSHSGYTDKTFFTADLFLLIVLAGLAYGLDATLRRWAPAPVARILMGQEAGPVPNLPGQPIPA